MAESITSNYHKSLSQSFTDLNLDSTSSASSSCGLGHPCSAPRMLHIRDPFKYSSNPHVIRACLKHQAALLDTQQAELEKMKANDCSAKRNLIAKLRKTVEYVAMEPEDQDAYFKNQLENLWAKCFNEHRSGKLSCSIVTIQD